MRSYGTTNIAKKLGFRAKSQPDPDLDLEGYCTGGAFYEVRRGVRRQSWNLPELEDEEEVAGAGHRSLERVARRTGRAARRCGGVEVAR